ncbi:MAG: hypothetical protein M3527_02760 [Actinomycetota bacterium]|nr:hypothetical protein [Actinomycetota bacterium]
MSATKFPAVALIHAQEDGVLATHSVVRLVEPTIQGFASAIGAPEPLRYDSVKVSSGRFDCRN